MKSMVKKTKDIIREEREKRGLSQKKLGQMIGVSQQHIDRYEKGYQPPIDKVEKLSHIFQIEKWKLLPEGWQPTQTNDVNKDTLRLILKEIDSYLEKHNLDVSVDDKVKWITIVYERLQNLPAEQQKSQAEMMIDLLAQAANQ